MKTTALLFATLLLQLPAVAQAQMQVSTQDVWRCGAGGRSYSTTSCSDGHPVNTADTRPAADVAAAQRLAQRDALQAEQMRREFLQADARRVGNGYGALSASRPTAAVKSPAPQPLVKTRRTVHHRLAADGTSPAIAPVSRRTPG